MSHQIFKKIIDNQVLFNLFDNLCIKNDKCYTFNNSSYKKGMFDNTIYLFLEACKEYYHTSKIKYLNKKHTYNSFTTILRQICNFNKIKYSTEIKYDKSKYEIIYYIFYNTNTNN